MSAESLLSHEFVTTESATESLQELARRRPSAVACLVSDIEEALITPIGNIQLIRTTGDSDLYLVGQGDLRAVLMVDHPAERVVLMGVYSVSENNLDQVPDNLKPVAG